MTFNGLPLIVSALVPLTRIDPATGATVYIAYWKVDGRILMHPDRFAALERGLRKLDDLKATAREGLEAILEATPDDPDGGS